MHIMVLNCGSSSAKYQVYDWDNKDVLAVGVVEKVTQAGSWIEHKPKGKPEFKLMKDCPDHTTAVDLILKTLTDPEHGVIKDMNTIKAVGHRVLHGGDKLTKSVIVDDSVLKVFDEVKDLGPLHIPANVMGIKAAQKSAAERASRCGYGYGMAPDNAADKLYVRRAVRVVRKIRRAPLRLPRHIILVCCKTCRRSAWQKADRNKHHHLPYRQRLICMLRKRRLRIRHIDGHYTA
ncbi:MAG: hypothetical protein Ta2G_18200 [Termitinemataceae bacterium]|nr:MAG: hypothetical protein Ta2G_18200 [Termitinemataceae bacterium]